MCFSCAYTGGAGLDLECALKERRLLGYFPLHQPAALRPLQTSWARWDLVRADIIGHARINM